MKETVLCRLAVAFVWIYHGLVPKLLGPHEDELAMNMALGLSVEQAHTLAYVAGAGEVAFGVLILILWKRRWPLLFSAAAMLGLLMFALMFAPALAVGAFNPVTTNLCVFVLSVVSLQKTGDRPVA